MANFHHNNRNRRGRNHNNSNREEFEQRDNRESREHKEQRDNRDGRDNRNHREGRDNKDTQVINTFTLGTKELDDKNAEFQYDKGWYSIIDIIGEEKNVVYKSRNAQEAYTKWNVYIGRKKERPQRAEKAE